MPFLAECVFCKGKVRVPDHALGRSVACPRCGSSFTLAPMVDPPSLAEAKLCKPPANAATFSPVAAIPAPGTDEAPSNDESAPQSQRAPWAGAVSMLLA